MSFKESVFNFLNIDLMLGCNVPMEQVNILTDEQIVGFGILGFALFLPLIFINIQKLFKSKNKRNILLGLLSITFLINILVLSSTVAYMIYSIRFILSFVCLSFLVFAFSYSKKSFYKPIIIFFVSFYMIFLPFFIKRMPFTYVIKTLKESNFNMQSFIKNAYEGKITPTNELAIEIKKIILEKYPQKKKIAILKTLSSTLLYLKTMDNYKIDFINPALITKEKLEEYDLIILEEKKQNDNIFNLSDVKINYKVVNNNVVFEKNQNLNCYYTNKKKVITDKEQASERTCFTYYFTEKYFTEDYRKDVYIKDIEETKTLYFFVNQHMD